jgi:hypothetical protein
VVNDITAARDEALKEANRVRIGRAQLKRQLKDGRDPFRLIQRPPSTAKGMRVYEFLVAVPGIGRSKANRILVLAHISPNRTLGKLQPLQRDMLVRALRDRGGFDELPG